MIKILDVTLRDGGLANHFAFTPTEMEDIVRSLSSSGVELIEVGYFTPRKHASKTGPSVCDPAYLASVKKWAGSAGTVVMAHTHEVEPGDYAMLRDHGVSLVRFPVSPKNFADVGKHFEAVRRLGMEFTFNIIRVSELPIPVLREYALFAQEYGASVLYIADSNGSLFPAQVTHIAGVISDTVDMPLGFHAHDNLTLAFANSLTAMSRGFRYLDSSLGGLGKGGCNLITELLAGHLNQKSDARYDICRMSGAYERNIAKWMQRKFVNRFDSLLCGFLDMNLDQIADTGLKAKSMVEPFSLALQARYHDAMKEKTHLILETT